MTTLPAPAPTPRTTEIHTASAATRPLALVVDPAEGQAERIALPASGVVVLGGMWATDGRGEDGARIGIADSTVSARHARIEVAHGKARIVDLGSRNGTWLGGARVEAAALSVGSCAILGRSAIALEEATLADDVLDDLPTEEDDDEPLPGAIGRAPSMRALGAAVRVFSQLSAPVLVRGESGSGKEVVARALHALSPRRDGPFHALNLGALPRELAEGELFGHERGAFTGAIGPRAGVFELADGGTLLLDELGELPLDMQAKLLRVLETSEVRRLGARTSKRIDVRVVAATWAPLEKRIAEGTFREDLFHRIAVLVLDVPPLRERRGDVPAIAAALLERSRAELGEKLLSPAAASRLSAESWPGNVRELRNVIYRAAAQARGETIEAADVARALTPRASSSAPPPPAMRPIRDARTAIDLVTAHGGSIAAAARACGVPRETLRDWVRAARRP
jgi:DNA-binding NtrC family response regulator